MVINWLLDLHKCALYFPIKKIVPLFVSVCEKERENEKWEITHEDHLKRNLTYRGARVVQFVKHLH